MVTIYKFFSRKFIDVPWAMLAIIAFLSIVVGFMMGSLTGDAPVVILFVIAGLLAFGMMFFSPRGYKFIFAIYIFIFLAAYDFIGYDPVLTFPLKLYFADGILLFMVVLALQEQ